MLECGVSDINEEVVDGVLSINSMQECGFVICWADLGCSFTDRGEFFKDKLAGEEADDAIGVLPNGKLNISFINGLTYS